MPDDAAFLAMILERPAEDGPRLVYADWLEEQGITQRAEFIRVQVELAKLPAGAAARPALLERERELLARHGQDWLAPLMTSLEEERKSLPPPMVPAPIAQMMRQFLRGSGMLRLDEGSIDPSSREWIASMFSVLVDPLQFQPPIESLFQCRFRRGFIERIDLLAADFVRHADTLFAQTPLLEIGVHDRPLLSGFGDFFRLPGLARLEGLEVKGLLALGAVVDFLDCPYLAGLLRLSLERAVLTRDDALAICQADNLSGLRELQLRSMPIGDDGAIALARNPHFASLESLDLQQTGLTDGAALALARSSLSHLKTLDLSHNQITGVGAVALAESPSLNQLTSLDLSFNQLSDSLRQGLNRYLARLMGKESTMPWLQRFLQAPLADRLTSCILARNDLDPADRAVVENRLGFRVCWV